MDSDLYLKKLDDELYRSGEALSYMKLCLWCSFLALGAQIIGIIMAFSGNHRWWMLFLASWVAMIVGELYKRQAKKIYPEGFKHE